jgi:hypothetical protein
VPRENGASVELEVESCVVRDLLKCLLEFSACFEANICSGSYGWK